MAAGRYSHRHELPLSHQPPNGGHTDAAEHFGSDRVCDEGWEHAGSVSVVAGRLVCLISVARAPGLGPLCDAVGRRSPMAGATLSPAASAIRPDPAGHRGSVGARQRGAADTADAGQGGSNGHCQQSLLHFDSSSRLVCVAVADADAGAQPVQRRGWLDVHSHGAFCEHLFQARSISAEVGESLEGVVFM